MNVPRINETHLKQAEQIRTNYGEMLIYSSHVEENAPHTQEFTLMLFEKVRRVLIG